MKITIQGRELGDGCPLFLIAEIGVTCDYDMDTARKLMDAAAAAGADAVKFIFWFPDEILADESLIYTFETAAGTRSESLWKIIQNLRFSLDQWRELKAYADSLGLILFSTVNSKGGLDYAQALNLPAYKMSSWDYNHLPLWRLVAAQGKPVIIDTGPVGLLDVAKIVDIFREAGNRDYLFLHCSHAARPRDNNMRSLPYMRKAFRCPVGYSSNDQASEMDLLAVALGACCIEKRLTLNSRAAGHHHFLSLEPEGFARWARMIREAHESLGVEDLVPSAKDLEERKKWFRHLVFARDLPAGTVLEESMFEGKRPEQGVSPEFLGLLVGRVLRRDVKRNEALAWTDV